MENSLFFYVILATQLQDMNLRNNKFVKEFKSKYFQDISKLFCDLLDLVPFSIQTSSNKTLKYSSIKLILKAVKKISILIDSTSIIEKSIDLFLWGFNEWNSSLNSVSSPLQQASAQTRQYSKLLIKFVSILKANFNVRQSQQPIITRLLPVLSSFYLENNVNLEKSLLDSKATRASFKMLRLLNSLTDDLLFNDFTLDLTDSDSFVSFSESFKENLKKVTETFTGVFNRICFLSQHHFYLRLLRGVSQNQQYAEFLFSQFSCNFSLQQIGRAHV